MGHSSRVNHALCALLGRDEASVTSSTWQELTHRDDLDADLTLVADVLAGRIDTLPAAQALPSSRRVDRLG